MTTQRRLEIKVLSEEEAMLASAARFTNAWERGEYAGEYLTFTSPALLFEILTARRWNLLVALHKIGKTSIQQLAQKTGQTLDTVIADIATLEQYGMVETAANQVYVPYAEIHADFTLRAEAA